MDGGGGCEDVGGVDGGGCEDVGGVDLFSHLFFANSKWTSWSSISICLVR